MKNYITNHISALFGLIAGLVSLTVNSHFILPLIAIFMSIIGLLTFDETKHRQKWQAVIGLLLGSISALANLDPLFYL